MDQFLRLRAMASRMTPGPAESVSDLRNKLLAGGTVEIAGYCLSRALCADIDALDLAGETGTPFPQTRWVDVVVDASAPVPSGTQRVVDSLRLAGCEIEHVRVTGEPFWTATEVVRNPALVAAS